jgi:ribosome-associated translation inhibitor RaiA
MNINISCKNYVLSAQTKSLLLTMTDHFSKYFSAILSVDWTLEMDRPFIKIRCRVRARSGNYLASSKAKTVREAAGLAIDKIEKQRRRLKRIKTRRSRAERNI